MAQALRHRVTLPRITRNDVSFNINRVNERRACAGYSFQRASDIEIHFLYYHVALWFSLRLNCFQHPGQSQRDWLKQLGSAYFRAIAWSVEETVATKEAE